MIIASAKLDLYNHYSSCHNGHTKALNLKSGNIYINNVKISISSKDSLRDIQSKINKKKTELHIHANTVYCNSTQSYKLQLVCGNEFSLIDIDNILTELIKKRTIRTKINQYKSSPNAGVTNSNKKETVVIKDQNSNGLSSCYHKDCFDFYKLSENDLMMIKEKPFDGEDKLFIDSEDNFEEYKLINLSFDSEDKSLKRMNKKASVYNTASTERDKSSYDIDIALHEFEINEIISEVSDKDLELSYEFNDEQEFVDNELDLKEKHNRFNSIGESTEEINQSKNDAEYEVNRLLALGNDCIANAEYIEALDAFYQALDLHDNYDDKNEEIQEGINFSLQAQNEKAISLNQKATELEEDENYREAEKKYYQALVESIKNSETEKLIKNNLARIYISIEQQEQNDNTAYKLYCESIEVIEIYEDYISALELLREALKLCSIYNKNTTVHNIEYAIGGLEELITNSEEKCKILTFQAQEYYEDQSYHEALTNYREAYKVALDHNQKDWFMQKIKEVQEKMMQIEENDLEAHRLYLESIELIDRYKNYTAALDNLTAASNLCSMHNINIKKYEIQDCIKMLNQFIEKQKDESLEVD